MLELANGRIRLDIGGRHDRREKNVPIPSAIVAKQSDGLVVANPIFERSLILLRSHAGSAVIRDARHHLKLDDQKLGDLIHDGLQIRRRVERDCDKRNCG